MKTLGKCCRKQFSACEKCPFPRLQNLRDTVYPEVCTEASVVSAAFRVHPKTDKWYILNPIQFLFVLSCSIGEGEVLPR